MLRMTINGNKVAYFQDNIWTDDPYAEDPNDAYLLEEYDEYLEENCECDLEEDVCYCMTLQEFSEKKAISEAHSIYDY